MGKASSTKKVARAARTSGRPGASRSYGWTALVTGVVILGAVLIVVSRGKTGESTPPKLGDHWHAAYGLYDCDNFQPPLTDQVSDETGIHTHADGLIHIHPFSTAYTGANATLNAWGITVGLELTDDSITTPTMDRENGDACGDEEGIVQVKVWSGPEDETGRTIDSDLGDYAPQDFDIITIAFAPEGAEIPRPPEQYIEALKAPVDVVGGQQPSQPTSPPASVVDESSVPPETTDSSNGDTTVTTTAGSTPSTTATSTP